MNDKPPSPVVCGVTYSSCQCRLPFTHAGLHECCNQAVCDGSWGFDAAGEFVIGRLPLPFRPATNTPSRADKIAAAVVPEQLEEYLP